MQKQRENKQEEKRGTSLIMKNFIEVHHEIFTEYQKWLGCVLYRRSYLINLLNARVFVWNYRRALVIYFNFLLIIELAITSLKPREND